MKDILILALSALALLYLGAYTFSQYHNTKNGKMIIEMLNIPPIQGIAQAQKEYKKCPVTLTFENSVKHTE